jgi:hypothetical protein
MNPQTERENCLFFVFHAPVDTDTDSDTDADPGKDATHLRRISQRNDLTPGT